MFHGGIHTRRTTTRADESSMMTGEESSSAEERRRTLVDPNVLMNKNKIVVVIILLLLLLPIGLVYRWVTQLAVPPDETNDASIRLSISKQQHVSQQKNETNMKQTGGVGEETLIMDGQPQQQLMTVKNEKLAHSELESYCNKKFELEQGPRPIPDASVWMLLKKLYVDHFVKVGIGSFESSAIMRPSLLVPYKVGQVEKGGGRGLFATRDIPKFTHIYNGTGTHATFSKANLMKYMRLVHEYTQALDLSLQTNNATVNNKKDLVCDLLHWNYHEYDEKKEVYYYILCLDDSSLMNHNEKHPNVGNCLENLFGNKGSFATKDFCHENLFALRDITAGEEIVENYGRFDLEYVNGKLKE